MRIPGIFSFLGLSVRVISGFTLPANDPDGMYKAYYDKDGKEVHEPLTPEIMARDRAATIKANLVAPATPSLADTSKQLKPRQYRGSGSNRRLWCECGENMDHSDCDMATDELRLLIEEANGTVYVPISTGYYRRHGAVVTFICSPPENQAVTPITREIYDYALWFITDRCGHYVPGSYIHGELGKSMEHCGYMRTKFPDTQICDHVMDALYDKCSYK